ncbi:regulatory protein LuxR [Mycolicibacterium canariasense]|uniref:Regulatory protein LuxR n=1 Tax=Mycolicibacterium canariasense TaxID=228230 RepID=A0A117IBI8_MYCCR|nr:LuxR family transcriptional regulator [Mycolicibacterium canariasense]GAS98025.1 regulatory protein LuxR [Mycolicibacterium canariasense]
MQVSGYSVDDRLPKLLGRRDECAVLDGIVAALRSGESRALVIRGEPGIGKTALLNHLANNAGPCRVERTAGIQSEMEFAFAGIHQLCMPLLGRLDGLPAPQQAALSTALGMAQGPAPDRFLVGLAVLNLLSNAATDRPLLCLIDDEQWLDRASAQILAFVARRLGSESVGMVFAAREPTQAVAGLPTLVVRGLRGPDANALLDSALTVPMDPRIRQQIIAETHGNPLALLELPRGLKPDELAGGFGLPGGVHLPAEMEQTFGSRIRALPDATRRLLLLAAAEPTGDSALIWRAAGDVGVASEEAAPAIEAGLASFGGRVKFRHPLVRSAAYRSASLSERQQAHRALATATDPGSDPDRRAWHLAHAVTGPDETVAAELEASAGRAQARGGISAAAAFLERAAMLSVDSAKRSERALAAASAKVQLGAFDSAQDLLAMAEAQRPSDRQRARGDLIRAQIAYISNHGRDAPPLLLSAAKRLESIDVTLSRVTYMDAMLAAMFAGRLALNANVFDVALAAQTAPRPAAIPDRRDLLLDWLILHYRLGYVAARPALGAVLAAFDDGVSPDEELICALLASSAAHLAWDDDRFDQATRRHVDIARGRGAIGDMPVALSSRATALLFFGDLAGAAAVVDELEAAQEATGSRLAPYAALGLAALRGEQADAMALIEATVAEVTARGEGNGLTVAWWAEAVLHNGSGDYRRALGAAELAAQFPPELASANWALPELVEAAARSGEAEKAADALTRLEELTAASGTDWALGLGARSSALLQHGADAERLYLESIERFSRTRVRGDLARAHLLYGEWLRRERRRADAREQLRIAHTMFVSMTMNAFAERTQRELRAVGDTAMRERTPFDADRGLTAQESQVARLARDGLSNAEIGARLFISARTVQYHLSKVFAKLDVSSRSQLDRALPPGDGT